MSGTQPIAETEKPVSRRIQKRNRWMSTLSWGAAISSAAVFVGLWNVIAQQPASAQVDSSASPTQQLPSGNGNGSGFGSGTQTRHHRRGGDMQNPQLTPNNPYSGSGQYGSGASDGSFGQNGGTEPGSGGFGGFSGSDGGGAGLGQGSGSDYRSGPS